MTADSIRSASTQIASDAVLLSPAWVDASWFGGFRIVEVDPAEPMAANALLVGADVASRFR